MPRGGARPNSGPKKKAATILKQLEIENAHKHAAESLQMLVEMRDKCKGNALDREFKKACCESIMNRVWGNNKNISELTGKNGAPLNPPRLDLTGVDIALLTKIAEGSV